MYITPPLRGGFPSSIARQPRRAVPIPNDMYSESSRPEDYNNTDLFAPTLLELLLWRSRPRNIGQGGVTYTVVRIPWFHLTNKIHSSTSTYQVFLANRHTLVRARAIELSRPACKVKMNFEEILDLTQRL